MENSDIVLEMKNISKVFPGVRALSNVDFTLRKGEIHTLMGENGAGKSTLIKVLTGVYKIDEGTIILRGNKIKISSTEEAQSHGISTVYQEVNLCANLTVAENIYIGREPMKHGSIDWKKMNTDADKLLQERLNLKIDVKKALNNYSVAVQQMVAIARAVDISKGILILDEPTSSLDEKEVKQLFKIMKKFREEGMSIIFVTHFLDQVYEVSDKLTVLRNGELVGTYDADKLPRIELVSKMIGKDYSEIEKNAKTKKEVVNKERENFIKTDKFGRIGTISPFDIEIKKGEILGFAGLLGSGRSECARAIFGIDKATSGKITINGKSYSYIYPQKAIEEGIGFCPEDRKVEGIVGDLTIRENIILALQARKGIFKYIPMKKQQEISQKYIDLLRIKTPSMEQKISNLSGGNQQKVILARWLATEPELLILDEPTRGIDIGAKNEITELILKLAKQGMTILFISSELPEVVKCCDRVIVLRDRNVIGELSGDEIEEGNIMKTIAGGATA
ncbi:MULTISPECIES: sugar ABC transporter ATP-binding protein [Clostridium]|jgi:simple sugar transport system ATP-binding protein|uniref:Monosaccharide ABC transporter ATP-binding protein, CUT2 family n=1 Tax=Clostridium saccharoperbutylacetonicum N1-4(HMT) TaxID=931276 RepID=M1MUU4_9CLOT|nr:MULTISPECIES: sugar ABC transporter ATP-binding protein [Clostridium]AGF58451.1 monosaccharide ABC transporter ATP-binding protein, CUT2 family [Clostridium saccharoperbutylacetonicum N1-4(HMT)]AQR97144.1 arabinose import ATP-binding protein AraG [Clostridium saccharoperbutylacetonicum]NRT60771.1 simple sugar transport system ATP-binding protein [Clostridium saccharoperbutylacetonicum]NSB24085.1 simple sugar transport system ATP-binding protein [Clostridium saccharoperbutylacetonicum]NSB330